MSRVNHEPAFVLSSTPWKESSARVEVFSRHYGRVVMLARSVRKRQSELRGVLMPFMPLSLSWFGVNELRTLHRAQWLGGWPYPSGRNLLSAWYVNELILKLTAREDAHESLYDALYAVMHSLSAATHPHGALRVFEWSLLRACGFAPDLRCDENGAALEAEALYLMRPEAPPQPVEQPLVGGLCVRGSTLSALAAGCLDTDEALSEALRLNRMLLDFRLPGNIRSRHLLQQMTVFQRT